MRHQKAGKALGVTPSHRRAMVRNMVTSLLEHQQIKTTLTRAKEVRKVAEKMITFGKKGDLNARRQALTIVKSKEAMKNLFGEIAERYTDRAGGYTRIIPMGNRLGDNAQLALLTLVDGPKDPFAGEAKKAKKGAAKKPKKVLDQVAEKVVAKKEAPAAEAAAEAPAEKGE